MPISLRSAAKRQRRAQRLSAGVRVRYHSVASGDVYSIVVVPLTSSGELETTEGLTLAYHTSAFLVEREALPVMPQRLDRIEWIDGDRVEWFTILGDGTTDSVSPSDPFRDSWKLEAKWTPAEGS